MHDDLINRMLSLKKPEEIIEIRTVDGLVYVWDDVEIVLDEENERIIGLQLRMPNKQSTAVAAEHIVVLNVVHDHKAVYGLRTGQGTDPI